MVEQIPKPELAPLPMEKGEEKMLLNKYIGGGFSPDDAYTKMKEITKDRPAFTPASVTNSSGLTIEEASDPKYWKDGKYVGVDQTLPPEDETGVTTDTGDVAGDLDDEEQNIIDETDAGATLGNSHTKTLETAYANMQDMDDEFNKITQEITGQYKQRFDNLNLVNKGIKGNTFTANLVSGRARYASKIAEGNMGAAETAAQGRVSALTADMNKEISLAKTAAKTGARADYQALSQHLATIRDIQADRIDAAKDALQLSVNIDKWGREKAQFDREEMEASAENIASSLYSVLGDDPIKNSAIIQDAAEEYGIDPNLLTGTVNAYAQEDRENQIAFSEKLINIGAKIEEGQQVELAPGVIVTGTKSPDEKWVTSISGNTKFNDLYVKKNGEFVRTQRINQGQAYKPTGTDTTAKDTYYTKPNEDGVVEFFFGQKGKPEDSISLSSSEYLRGKSASEGVLGDEEPEIKITEDWLRKKLGDNIESLANDSGFDDKFGRGVGETGKQNYLDWVMGEVQSLEEVGYSPKEIIKELKL